MATKTENRIYRLSGLCGFLAAISFIIPPFIPNTAGGFSQGSTAILTLLIMLLLAMIFSLYLLAVTGRAYSDISMAARIAGVVPSFVLVVTLVGIFSFLSY